ncbi:sulfotransferase family 2 domain-containing protein [Pararhodobacter oceanensis]|uniref:sulfotransferase family 2 domain-containing protein n=1 Tax=Pararhodobacter oceanensis TaxID=2172121 RepID=UPI003A90C86F
MAVILDQHQLAYFAVPKTACTSIKTMFFEIENGFAFHDFRASGRYWWIHHFYKTLLFARQNHARIANHCRIAVVRDPIQRLLSCYSNRVLHHKELSQANARAQLRGTGLPFDPNLRDFVSNLRGYMAAVESINHHARPMVDYLGRDTGYFARLYRMSELDTFVADVSAATGTQVGLPRLQTGGPRIEVDTLSKEVVTMLREFYAEDYEVFAGFL